MFQNDAEYCELNELIMMTLNADNEELSSMMLLQGNIQYLFTLFLDTHCMQTANLLDFNISRTDRGYVILLPCYV